MQMIYRKETVFNDKACSTRRKREEVVICYQYSELNPYSMSKMEKVSLVLGLIVAENSLCTKVVLILGGAKVKLLDFLMGKT